MLVKYDLNYVLKGSFWQLDGEQAEEARMKPHMPCRRLGQRWFGPSSNAGGEKSVEYIQK